ncbi:MAG: hypothetical protein ACI3VZ_08630 [Faecousia sp.]
MKRDFLKNFKVGDQPLPDEIVDAIMAENGRDIEAAKKPFGDYMTNLQRWFIPRWSWTLLEDAVIVPRDKTNDMF